MKISPLQKARYEYTPKLPGMLRNGIAEISVKEGEATQSVADQEKIAELFPNTYGKPEITFIKGQNTAADKKQVVGVILSGGQAPGGHNVVSGLYDALKATNKDNVLLGSAPYMDCISSIARQYVAELFSTLRKYEYNPDLMRLYVVGGGGCLIRNFGTYDKSRVTIIDDICATAKGYESLAYMSLKRRG